MEGKAGKNISTALHILEDEIRGDVAAALAKMSPTYSMTWVYVSPQSGELFPRTTPDFKSEMEEVYRIEGRRYDIKRVLGDEASVMIEMVESYPAPGGGVYRTPLVLVLEFDADGKIARGRHYCDPHVSHLKLSEEQIGRIFGTQ
jgi:ketosteroid isomerase-like protein